MKPHPAVKSLIWLVVLALTVEVIAVLIWGDQFATQFSEGYHPDAAFERSGNMIRVMEHTARNMWPQEIETPKPPDRIRVIVVGDSVARGGSLKDSYAWKLAELYNRKVKTGPRLESFNLSASGYGVRRKNVLLEKALQLEPDLIIAELGGTNEMEDERHWDRAQRFNSWGAPFLWPLKLKHIRFLVNRRTEELVWRYIPLEIRKKIIPDDIEAEVLKDPADEREKRWRDRLSRGISKMVDQARQAKVPLVLMVRAVYDYRVTEDSGSLHPPDLADGMTKFLESEAEKHRDEVMAVAPYGLIFRRAGLTPSRYKELFIDSRHFTPKGHDLTSEYLVNDILIPLFSRPQR